MYLGVSVNKILGYFKGISNIRKGMEAVSMLMLDLLFNLKSIEKPS